MIHSESPQNEQAAVRPSLLRAPVGHTVSRRSAAARGANAPAHRARQRDARRTLTNTSHHLSGGCSAVVRAECTAARLLARWHHEPTRQEQQEAAGEAGEVGRHSCAECAICVFTMALSCERNVDFEGKRRSGPKIFFACGALVGASPTGPWPPAQDRDPSRDAHTRRV